MSSATGEDGLVHRIIRSWTDIGRRKGTVSVALLCSCGTAVTGTGTRLVNAERKAKTAFRFHRLGR